MKRIVLFSMPTENNKKTLEEALFPKKLKQKTLAYMPSDGHQTKQIYTDFWNNLANKNNTDFLFVDNLLPANSGEAEKIEQANILLISGGNTFGLLNNLRVSGLDMAIKKFVNKKDYLLSGFSAGAIVLSPNINTAQLPSGNDPNDLVDENIAGLTDLTGLQVINFEIVPHFDEVKDRDTLVNYRLRTKNEVREISDDGIIIIDN